MSATKTIHPPAGATALLAATSPEITELGWYLLALVMLGSTLMLGSACIINNIHRRFPVYWWTPQDLSDEFHRGPSSGIETASQAEKEQSDAASGHLNRMKTKEEIHYEHEHEIKITADRIVIPDWLEIDDWEKNVLQILRHRLKVAVNDGMEWNEERSGRSEATAISSDEDRARPPV